MKKLILSPAAQADVDEIWDYTAATWSTAQAERYVRTIRDACRDLAGGARTSRAVPTRPGYRKTSVGSHAVYFREADRATIVVVRILHQRMDADRHL
jgi:toxin ParE1/3/4